MEFERIEVESRDEYMGAQEPLAFLWRGRQFRIVEVLDRWYEGRMDSKCMPLRYFRVRTEGEEVFILRYHELFVAWSLLIPASEE